MAEYIDDVINCAFCDDPFPSVEKMGEHLMMCGNKTDQCPNCGKYIRRAIFVYHYENDCANPDAPSNEEETPKKTQNTEIPFVSIRCKFCNQNYDRNDRKMHQEHCLGKLVKPNQVFYDENFNGHSDQSQQLYETDDTALIPCEYCDRGVSWNIYKDHTKKCREEYQQQQQQRKQPKTPEPEPTYTSTNVFKEFGYAATSAVRTVAPVAKDTFHNVVNAFIPVSGRKAVCKYCERVFSSNGITYHELNCTKNPKRTGTRH